MDYFTFRDLSLVALALVGASVATYAIRGAAAGRLGRSEDDPGASEDL